MQILLFIVFSVLNKFLLPELFEKTNFTNDIFQSYYFIMVVFTFLVF